MTDPSPIINAYTLDGNGGGRSLSWDDIQKEGARFERAWIHLDCRHENTEKWLGQQTDIDQFIIDGLLADETRPRCTVHNDGILLILRGVNLNPGSSPEDMVSIRMWFDENKVISTRLRRLAAVHDVEDQIKQNRGPKSTSQLVARLASRLTARMAPVIENLGDHLADIENNLLDARAAAAGGQDPRESRHALLKIRQTCISLRRYIGPQKTALNDLFHGDAPWFNDLSRGRLRETIDQVTRIIEELDELRDRSSIVQDELASRTAQRMERTMYLLTIVATVMLPLGFITGLLGVNVGGIPGAETKWAFWALCGVMIGVAAVELWLLRRLKWL